MSDIVPVLFLVGVFLLFWVAIARPASRKRRELQDMQSTLEVGDEVMLTSGLYGTLRALDEDTAQVEIAPGVTIKVARGAVGQLLGPDVPTQDDPPDDEHETHHAPDVSEEN